MFDVFLPIRLSCISIIFLFISHLLNKILIALSVYEYSILSMFDSCF